MRCCLRMSSWREIHQIQPGPTSAYLSCFGQGPTSSSQSLWPKRCFCSLVSFGAGTQRHSSLEDQGPAFTVQNVYVNICYMKQPLSLSISLSLCVLSEHVFCSCGSSRQAPTRSEWSNTCKVLQFQSKLELERRVEIDCSGTNKSFGPWTSWKDSARDSHQQCNTPHGVLKVWVRRRRYCVWCFRHCTKSTGPSWPQERLTRQKELLWHCWAQTQLSVTRAKSGLQIIKPLLWEKRPQESLQQVLLDSHPTAMQMHCNISWRRNGGNNCIAMPAT